VEGNRRAVTRKSGMAATQKKAVRAAMPAATLSLAPTANGNDNGNGHAHALSAKLRSEIPMDGDFKDF